MKTLLTLTLLILTIACGKQPTTPNEPELTVDYVPGAVSAVQGLWSGLHFVNYDYDKVSLPTSIESTKKVVIDFGSGFACYQDSSYLGFYTSALCLTRIHNDLTFSIPQGELIRIWSTTGEAVATQVMFH